jgi:biopolymer transport protein ExbB
MSYIQLLHDLTFYAMYIAAGISLFVIIERKVFYWTNKRASVQMLQALSAAAANGKGLPAALVAGAAVPALLVRDFLAARRAPGAQAHLEDISEAIYIAHKQKVVARLWALDTIVTAAPLLGLVGTILGIIDTFAVLASSGISDPAGISKGIGTALYATALGISIALFGLLFYNYFRESADRLNDQLKVLLLRAGSVDDATDPAR